MNEFLNMGGFGAYIWGAMAVALFFIIAEPLMLVIQRKSILKDIRRANRLEQRQTRQKQEQS